MKKYIYILSILLLGLTTACSDEDFAATTVEQESLIGRAVNFNVSIADLFNTRAVGYSDNDNGAFNQNDRMRIFRNYWDADNGKWSENIAYRTYYFKYKYGAGDINLGTDWLPEAGRKGYDDKNKDGVYEEFVQQDNDSLTWDNGSTLRFRAWSLSNYHNVLRGATKDYFYADFCLADWVNASGPTHGIPLVLKHQGCRLQFRMLDSGNEFNRIEICANIDVNGNSKPEAWMDYKYADNADTNEHDGSSSEAGKTDQQAQEECNLVTDAFMRMCMPAGVDMTTGQLMTVKSDSWNSLSDAQVRALEDQHSSIFIKYGTLPAEGDVTNIKTHAKHPFFSIINGYPIMVTIPYDMSTDPDKQGEVITLPACTRFRVYLYDVNNGDGFDTSNYEGKYHIFALSDVKKKENGVDVPAFPNGLKLEAGASYTFRVGYRYGGLYVVVDNELSWENSELPDVNGTDENDNYLYSTSYGWWKEAIHTAIPKGTEDYDPKFKISNETEFYEFIKLVNGDAVTQYVKDHPLYRLVKSYKQTTVGGQTITEPDEYGWSTVNSQYNPQWIEESEAEALGYIFFDHYYAANADKPAYSDRDYLKGPYSFYDDNLRRNFLVTLQNDLDLKDYPLASIGTSTTPFMGNFDGYSNGQVHTIKNVNMTNEYIFGYIDGRATNGAAITNLKIESVHNTALLNTGVNPIYIAGISLHAPSSGNSIATSLSMNGITGTSYVVGCIHVGDAGGPLVGTASNMNMFGCMQVAQGLGSGGALIGTDANSPTVFKPQYSLNAQKTGSNVNARPTFRNFMCNYYDKTLSGSAHAVGTTTDDYSLREYIRGSTTDILCAKNDLLLDDVPMATILSRNYSIYYGLAPWRAMNYAIYWYNENRGGKHLCNVHFESNSVGYNHRYPTLESQDPATKYGKSTVSGWNPTEQPN